MPSPNSRQSPERLVAIDGPAGAGKTTVARRVAAHFDMALLDTGAIYRSLALHAESSGVAWDDEAGLAQLAETLPLQFLPRGAGQGQQVMLDDVDVSEAIRAARISEGASQVSVFPAVRRQLLDIQRRLAAQSSRGCVAEGRDMGTVVFPDAIHKFFLTANEEARARRRHAELVQKSGDSAPSLTDVTVDMEVRDERDSTRAQAPLARAEDAVLIDSSALDADQVVALIVRAVERTPPPQG